jgi:hypothetical protein
MKQIDVLDNKIYELECKTETFINNRNDTTVEKEDEEPSCFFKG